MITLLDFEPVQDESLLLVLLVNLSRAFGPALLVARDPLEPGEMNLRPESKGNLLERVRVRLDHVCRTTRRSQLEILRGLEEEGRTSVGEEPLDDNQGHVDEVVPEA